jgi:DNA-binding NtrC family response regulator
MAVRYMITAKSGYTRGSSWLVDKKPLTIGRSYRCDIVVDDSTVSRQHCRVIKVLDGVRLEDLGSRNPALVDGIPEKDAVLEVGDEFSVGRAVFLVTSVAQKGGGDEAPQQATETISVGLDELSFDGQDQHSAWPGTSADYVLLFRFCRVCSHLKSETALANQMREVLDNRFGACAVHLISDHGAGWPVAETLGDGYEEIVTPESIDRALEKRRAFSYTAKKSSVDGSYVFVAPLFHSDMALGVAALMMTDFGGEGDRETVLTLFSALSELVGPYLFAAREHERLVGLNRRLAEGDPDGKMPLVGRGRAMNALRGLVLEAARTPLNVLITGETGTGKELIATAVHRNSARADKPFVIVNCAAIPAELLESELFGHERGAFTGAHVAKKGLLALADGGVLFLDEIGDLSLENQARILRVLEQGTYRSVGATTEKRVDVRFVAATNRSVEDEGFRSDLYHRLAGFGLQALALRERPEDIPVLAQYFMDQVAAKDERLIHVLSEDAADALSTYPWPGNVRQLRNTVERIAHRTPSPLISVEDIWRDGLIGRTPSGEHTPLSTLADTEREHILKTLRICEGNRSKSARILGISRSTLYLKLAEYGVNE